jgi:hypothetical protein
MLALLSMLIAAPAFLMIRLLEPLLRHHRPFLAAGPLMIGGEIRRESFQAEKLTILQREGDAGLGLQPVNERFSHRRGRGPESSTHRDVARQTDAALCNHLGRRTVAGVFVALDRDPESAAIAGLADKQDVVEAGVAGRGNAGTAFTGAPDKRACIFLLVRVTEI